MSDYGHNITAVRLYKKTSAKGSTYFVGRMGMVKVALLKSNDTADDGGEVWNLVYQQAEERPRQDAKPTRDERAKANEPPRDPMPSNPSGRPMPNDAIPF
jgi:hypothetical protein